MGSVLQISEAAFKIAGVILFLVALDMLAAKDSRGSERKTSDQQTSSSEPENDNPAIYPLAIPLLAGPAAIMSVIVVNESFAGALTSTIIGCASLIAVMVATGLILCMTVIAESWLNERVTMVFSGSLPSFWLDFQCSTSSKFNDQSSSVKTAP